MKKKFENREELDDEVLSSFLNMLSSINSSVSKKIQEFLSDADVYPTLNKCIDFLQSEIDYQEQIALKILQNFGGPEPINISNYYWECCLANEEGAEGSEFFEINLHMTSNDKNMGDIIFQTRALKASDNTYRIWEVIDIDDALASVVELTYPT